MTNNALNGNGRVHNGSPNAINDTQETCKFIEEVVRKCADNSGYVFAPEVIGRLSSLKQEDRLAFETLRVRLKKMGFRLVALDEVVANSTSEAEREPSQTDVLIGLANDIDLFHDANGVAYADIEVSGHRETWSVRSEGFAHWLSRQFFKDTKSALIPDTLRSSLANFEAQARLEGREQSVFLRIGSLDEKLCRPALFAVLCYGKTKMLQSLKIRRILQKQAYSQSNLVSTIGIFYPPEFQDLIHGRVKFPPV